MSEQRVHLLFTSIGGQRVGFISGMRQFCGAAYVVDAPGEAHHKNKA